MRLLLPQKCGTCPATCGIAMTKKSVSGLESPSYKFLSLRTILFHQDGEAIYKRDCFADARNYNTKLTTVIDHASNLYLLPNTFLHYYFYAGYCLRQSAFGGKPAATIHKQGVRVIFSSPVEVEPLYPC